MEKTIPEIVEDIVAEMCLKYCKYTDEYDDCEKMMEEKCSNCPLNRLT